MLCWLHTITSSSHRYPYVSSLFNLPAASHAIPSLWVVTDTLSSLCHTANSHFLSIVGMAMYVSMFHSQLIPSSPFPTVTSLFSMSRSLLLPCNKVLQCHFSRFHIYASIYDICFSLSDLLNCIIGLGSSTSLELTQTHSFL